MGVRSVGVALVAAVCLMGTIPLPSAAAQEAVGLAVDPSQQLTLNVGDERGEPELQVRFLATKALPSVPTASLPPFQTAEGDALDGEVKAEVTRAQEDRTVLASLTFTKIDNAEAGTYTSSLLLLGKGMADARATVTLEFDPKPVWGADLWAVLLLLAGAILGLVGRQVVTVAAKLKSQGDRLAVVEAKLRGFEPLPVVFRGKLAALRIQLARGSAESSEATLKEIEDQAVAATQVAEAATSMRDAIAGQEKQIAAMQNLGEAAGKLANVLAAERELIDAVLRSAEFESKAEADARAGYLNDVRSVRLFLQAYANEGSRAALEPALVHFMHGEFKAGDEKATAALAEPAPPLAAAPPPEAATPESVSPSKLQGWVVRNAATIAAGFTAIALVIVGLFTVYDPDTTFRTDAFMDAVSLFAWGLGSAAAGIGLAELTGKLTAGKAGTTG